MRNEKPRVLLSVLNVLGFIATAAVNYMANAVPLGGKTTGQLSDWYPNLFVPAGSTFAVWGLIYLLLAVYAAYGLIRSLRKAGRPADFVEKIGVLFLVTCAANAGWIFAWHYELLPLSLALMLILLLALIAIYIRLEVGRSSAPPAEKYLVHLPVSVYLGWISVATIANATALLVAYGWNGFGIGEEAWAAALVAVGTALGLIALFVRRDVFYAATVDWALIGILIKRTSEGAAPAPAVVASAIAGICLLSAGILVQVGRGRVYR